MIEMLKTREILKEHKKHYLCWSSCETGRWLLSRYGEAGRRQWMGLGTSARGGQIPPAQNSVSSKRGLQSCVCVCVWVCVCSCSVMSDSATIWTVTHQTRLSLERSRQEYWGGLPFATPGDFLTQGWSPSLRHCWHRQQTLYHWATWEAPKPWTQNKDILWRKERIYYQQSFMKKSFMKTSLQAERKGPPMDRQKYNGNQGTEPLAGRWKG